MSRNAPTIMVSSTCYDLKQVRKDLSRFIEELGYNPLLSEFDYFPIDPDLDTVENCRRRVEHDADIMVLIIGGRYGYVDPKSDKSITNLEYLTARAKGIPVYAFVDKGILPLLTMWERNPTADFGDTVPNTKVFEFIKQVRGKDSVWTIEFEHAQDIVQALKHQLAHQMLEGLNLRKQIRAHQSEIPAGVSSKAMRLVLEKPFGWEVSFFAQVLTDEVGKHSDTYQEYKLRLVFSKGGMVTHHAFVEWIGLKTREALRLAQTLSDLINVHLVEALSPDGVPANLDALAFVARKLTLIYKEALDWAIEVRRLYAEECIQPAIDELSDGLDDLINKVRLYGPETLEKIRSYSLNPDGSEIEMRINVGTSLGEKFADLVAECLQNCDSA
jgi:hypothetical protein